MLPQVQISTPYCTVKCIRVRGEESESPKNLRKIPYNYLLLRTPLEDLCIILDP